MHISALAMVVRLYVIRLLISLFAFIVFALSHLHYVYISIRINLSQVLCHC